MRTQTETKSQWKERLDDSEKYYEIPQNTEVFLKETNLQKLFFSGKITIEEYHIRKKILETTL
jgi:hypothetical protein